MKNIICAGALAIGLLVSALPMGAQAATAQAYAVKYTPLMGRDAGGSPFQGVLVIKTTDDGTIRGNYHLIGDEAQLTPVTGGLDASHNVWLQIGGGFRLRVNAKLDNGVMTGGAFDEAGHQFSFVATPESPNSP